MLSPYCNNSGMARGAVHQKLLSTWYKVQGTESHSPLSGPPEGQQAGQASRATKGGGVHHQSACASWPGEGFPRGVVVMMMAASRGRIWTEGVRMLAANTQPAEVTFSTCSPVLQPPSRLLCPEGPRNAFLRGHRVFATPRTRVCVCVCPRCVCIPHPRPRPLQANAEEEKTKKTSI